MKPSAILDKRLILRIDDICTSRRWWVSKEKEMKSYMMRGMKDIQIGFGEK
ncbi:MAG: hypothetical protein LIR50_11855 [Bacillota bacterium]|nr:hypothetical protein [Bacillota bacterium]